MPTELIHVGFDNYLAFNQVIAVAAPGSVPMKRLVQRSRQMERMLDLTGGRRTRAVVVLDNEWVALIAIASATFISRASAMRAEPAA